MLDLLKKLYSTKDPSAHDLSQALDKLDAALGRARGELAQLEASYGDRLVADPTGAAKLEQGIADQRREVSRLEAARNATERRLISAREAEAGIDLDAKWTACAAALNARGAALARLDSAIREAGAAWLAAEDAARAAWHAFPARSQHPELMPEFTHLSAAAHRLLEVSGYRPEDGVTNSLVWDMQQQPSLAEQHRKAAEHWLSFRIPHLPSAA